MSELDLDLAHPLPPSVDFGQIVYPPGAGFGPRRQHNVQLVVVYRGSADVTLDGEERFQIPADHVGLLRPGRVENFAFARHTETHHGWVHLSYFKAESPPPAVIGRLPACLPLTSSLRGLMDAALGLTPRQDATAPHARLLAVAMLQAYADAASPDAGASPAAPPPPPAVGRALHHMHEHLAQPLALADLAAAASVTPSHLVRLFGQHLQTTPMRRLWELRARRGVDLLRDTGLSVSEIAYRVGCQTPYHFSRLIRKHAGQPPTELRRKLWNRG